MIDLIMEFVSLVLFIALVALVATQWYHFITSNKYHDLNEMREAYRTKRLHMRNEFKLERLSIKSSLKSNEPRDNDLDFTRKHLDEALSGFIKDLGTKLDLE